MFEQTRACLDRIEKAVTSWNDDDWSKKESDWLIEQSNFDLAKAIYNEVPENDKVAKMICVAHDIKEIKVKVE